MTDQELALLRNPPKRNARLADPATFDRICELAKAGVLYRDLAQRFGINRSSIADIVKRHGASK